MRASSLLLLSLGLALSACSTGFGDKQTDDGSGEEDDGGGSDGGGGTVDDIDDIADDLDRDTSDCEEVQGQPVPGAVSYFIGSYVDQGDGSWRGTEQWLLIGNDRWMETEEDLPSSGVCAITWSVVATESEGTGSCAACDLGLEVSATIDLSNTDCPEGLYEAPTDMNWTASYAVLTNADGSADWFYQSGTPLGQGTNSGGVAEYASDPSCKWF